jgi:RNA polymerase sigma-70 factor (ECF subfamily)
MVASDAGSITEDAESLERLLAAVALGNRAAFEALYRATSRRLFGLCVRLLGDRAEAEDVLQETFATLWRKAAQYDAQRGGPMGWLAMIARNKAIDRRRSMSASRLTGPLALADDVADPTASPPQAAQAQIERKRLDGCLEQLDPRRRTLIHAAFFDGSTYEELATRTGSPLGTVKSWIRRGLQQLRECLGQ